MKRIITLLVCTLVVVGMVGCTGAKAEDAEMKTLGGDADAVEIANPIVEVDSLEQVKELLGFSIELPTSMPEGYELKAYRVFVEGSKMVEVIYKHGDDEIRIRKSLGTEENDGVFKVFTDNLEVEVDTMNVLLKGENQSYEVATWNNSEYAYSIGVDGDNLDSQKGLSEDELVELVKVIK